MSHAAGSWPDFRQDSLRFSGMLCIKGKERDVGPVEQAIKEALAPPVSLVTPMRNAPFELEKFERRGIVLLLGAQLTPTPISWKCLEGVPEHLRGRGWVKIGSKYELDSEPGTLDAYLKGCIARATGGWVAVVLEKAGVVDIRRERPAAVRLRDGH